MTASHTKEEASLSTPPAQGRAIAAQVKGARVAELAAAHISNVEAAEAFSAELLGFFTVEKP
jgi:3-oxoadipate enol-lactonase